MLLIAGALTFECFQSIRTLITGCGKHMNPTEDPMFWDMFVRVGRGGVVWRPETAGQNEC